MVFAPHPDDETLACGGTIAKSVRQGKAVYIVVMTDGRNSHKAELKIERNPAPEELIPIRRREARRAARILGVGAGHLVFLNFEDGDLASHYHEAKGIVLKLLSKFRPTEVLTPDTTDSHPDHRSTGAIVMEAVGESKLRPLVLTYIVWAGVATLEARASEETGFDISDFLGVKREAIDAYKSQFTRMFKSQSRPVIDESMVARFKRPVERFRVISGRPSSS